MKEYERKQLLERIERESATVGAEIPDRITVQDEELGLQEFVFEIKRRDTISAGERERVEQAKRNLRRERLQRKQRIGEGSISYEDVRAAVEADAQIVVNTDAHSTPEFEHVRYGVYTARRGWAEPADVLNAREVTELRYWLA